MFTESGHQVPPHAPSAAGAQEEVQDYLQGIASHDVLGLKHRTCVYCSSVVLTRDIGWGGGAGRIHPLVSRFVSDYALCVVVGQLVK